jgi:MOSC domain-containing protein YiiM
MPASPHLVSVNVSLPKPLGPWRGNTVHSSIAKEPVQGRVAVRGINLEGDRQTDWRVHGGPDKTVYAYAREDADWWAAELGRDIPDGMFGENLTTAGVDCTGAVIGERWRIGTAVLEVSQPRMPCFKLGLRFGDGKMLKRFAQASRPGVYFRIITEGELGVGDPIEVVDRPDHGVTVSLVSDAFLLDHALIPRALEAPQLAEALREMVNAA